MTVTLEIPTRVRSSYVTGLGNSCDNQWIPFLYPKYVFQTLWFLLGTATHSAIEYAIEADTDQVAEVVAYGMEQAHELAHDAGGWDRVLEMNLSNRRRTKETFPNDLETFIVNWMNRVPPWATNRDPIYNKLQWPPQVEIEVNLNDIRTTVDALFLTDDNKYYIVDWKSSATKSASPLQIQYYAYALRAQAKERKGKVFEFGDEDKIIGHYEYVALNTYQPAGKYWGDDDMYRWHVRTLDYMDSVRKRGPVLSPGRHCVWCHVRPVCPLYGGDWSDFNRRRLELMSNNKTRQAREALHATGIETTEVTHGNG